MGLFWSMEASPAGPRNIRMVQRNVERPLPYHLFVYLGHLSLSDLHVTQPSPRPLAITTQQRLVKGAEVRRLPIKEGCVRGTLFLPPGEGPFPGVIDMFGFAGGLMESRAAMMASHGFAALALPFFNYQDLPTTVKDVNFNYFEETVNWFASHSSVKKGGIGVVAVSGGATFALLMGWKLSQVVAVVLINSPIFYVLPDLYCGDRHFTRGGDWHSHSRRSRRQRDYPDWLTTGLRLNYERAIMTSEGLLVKNAWMYTEDVFIPIWESSTRVLALISDDDGQVPPQLGDKLQAMYPEERRHLIEVVHYPGAGHLLEPSYTPHCRFCFNPPSGSDLLWGGRKKEHAKAQEDSWHRIITFLHTHLPSS
ncbi:acyl-coenzyme A thioesterase 2, mitochondrial-like [Littorina saxatilis]|uniref:acyl-coenzyme A thioesterase 2, mitochondrial-like n=1 Tax=Littorina saxatilis TaxID=31220 RepID=UPI0038B5B167